MIMGQNKSECVTKENVHVAPGVFDGTKEESKARHKAAAGVFNGAS